MNKLAQVVMLGVAPALLSAFGFAQVAQSAARPMPGFHLPTMGGDLTYAISASESASTGLYNNGGTTESTNLSGDLAFLSQSRKFPFSAVYSGAMLAGTNGQPFSFVQNLALSQVYINRFWTLTGTDSVSYLPESASTGLSGIAGLGDMGVDPIATGLTTGQGALTGYAPRVTNATTASLERRLTARTSIQGSGSFVIERFTGDNDKGLIDSNEAVGSLGGSHRIDVHSSVNANFTLSKITYSPDTLSSAFTVQGINVGYSRQFNPAFSLDATVGPQWVKTSFNGTHTSINISADVAARYQTRNSTFSASYVRGTNNGFGVIPGGFSDSVNSTFHRSFWRVWNCSTTVNYTRTRTPSALALPNFSFNTLVAGVQGSRSLTRSLSTYASYNAQHQSTGGVADTSPAFRGLFQVFAIGITYAPRTLSLGAR